MRLPIKNILIDTLRYWIYQLQNDKCTEETMRSIYKEIAHNTVTEADAKSIAEFYNQSESNVRAVISRKVSSKPKRRTFYNFNDIEKVKPENWESEPEEENE
jgi:hypothetical protein